MAPAGPSLFCRVGNHPAEMAKVCSHFLQVSANFSGILYLYGLRRGRTPGRSGQFEKKEVQK